MGDYTFAYCLNLEKAVIPSSIKTIGLYNFAGCELLTNINLSHVENIKDYAFTSCLSLEVVDLTSVKSIGTGAFAQTYISGDLVCNNLTKVDDYAFQNANISKFTAPILEEIHEGAFQGCAKLTNVVVPSSVKYIEKGAFAGCSSLASIELPFVGMGYVVDKTTGVISNVFSTDYNFGHIFSSAANPDNGNVVPRNLRTVTITGDYDVIDRAFINCERIQTLTISNNVKNIGVEAFRNCTSLKNFAVPQNLEHMGASAFENCSSLVSFELPQTITELSESVFSSCSKLQSLDLTYITYIGKYALFNCAKLEVVISGENNNYEVADSILYTKGQTQIIRYPSSLEAESFTIPSTVKVFGFFFFSLSFLGFAIFGLNLASIPFLIASAIGEKQVDDNSENNFFNSSFFSNVFSDWIYPHHSLSNSSFKW